MTGDAINTQDETPRAQPDDGAAWPADAVDAAQPTRADDASQPPHDSASQPSHDSASQPAHDDPATRRPTHASAGPADDGPGGVLRLQPRLMPRSDGLYYVSEILSYHDEAFVEAAFAAVLRRAPAEEEFRHTLADLRNGAREKIDILRDLARSKEGTAQVAFERIAGLKRSRLAELARSLPVVGHLWQIIAAIIRLPVALRHQRQFEAYALAQQQRIADHVNALRLGGDDEALGGVASELRTAIADASAGLSLLSDATAETFARQAAQQSQFARHLEQVTLHLEEATRQLEHVVAQIDHAARRLDEAERRAAHHDARLDEHGRLFEEHVGRLDEHGRRLDAQQEFLLREQQAIVEAQKSAIADAEEGLREAVSAQRGELSALAARLDELRAAVDAAREAAAGKV